MQKKFPKISYLLALLTAALFISSCSLTGMGNSSAEECFAPGYACPGRITLSTSSYLFGNVDLSTTSTAIITVTNSRPSTATNISASTLSAPFSFLGGAYPGTGGTCGIALSANSSCTMVIQYAPTAFTTSTQTETLSYSDGYSSQSITLSLSGTGISAAPTITSLSPSSGVNSGGTSITITGTHFVSGALVTLGGTSCSNLSVVSSTSMTCDTGGHAAGVVNVTVTNADGQSATLLNGYTYTLPAPTLTSLSVASGNTTGGTSVTLTGTNFVNGATVTFGGTSATGVTFNSSTSITCNTPAHAAGVVSVVVTNPDAQTATLAASFTYNATANATLLISDGITYTYPNATPTFSIDKTFTVQNNGGVAATAVSGAAFGTVNFIFKGNAYPGTGGNCGVTINAAASCTIVVSFTPSTTGAKSDTITLDYNDGGGMTSATRAVAGTSVTPGSFDTTFGSGNGYVSIDLGSNDIAYSAALQSDGKLVLSGRSGTALGVVRLNTDGTLDTNFNSTGSFLDNINCSGNYATGVGVQSTGKIVTSCHTQNAGNGKSLLRLTSTGGLDTTFGTSGYFSDGNITAVGPIKIFSDDKIAFAGLDHDSNHDHYGIMAKVVADGTSISLDWDTATSTSTDVMPTAIGIQADGKVVSTVDDGWNINIFRMDLSGNPDTNFGMGNDGIGYLYWGIKGNDLAFKSDGSFVAVGTNFNPTTNYLVNSLSTDGDTPGTGVFGDYTAATTSSGGEAVAVQSNDKILVGGYATVSGNKVFGLARYLSDLSALDTTFGSSGNIVTTFASNGLSQIKRLLIQSDGKILAVGTKGSAGAYDYAVARFLP